MTKIYRDNFGVPHIEANKYSEAVYSIAYVHCEDDFYTIQQWLLASRKRSGHIDDWDAPYIDFICEFLEIEKYANCLKKNISAEYLDLIQSYCSGINEYAKENPKEVLKGNLFPILDIDIIKTQHLMEILGIQLDKPYSYISNNRKIEIPKRQGSNIIAITKSKSENGNAQIAINPHQQMEGLFSFYEIHLKIKQPNIELYGFILPCTFTIFMGTNFKTAWGVVEGSAGADSDGQPVYRGERSERNSSSAPAGRDGIESELSLFFDSYKPEDFAVRWRTILEAYSAQDYYKQGSPSDVLYAIERLTDLIKAAHEIFRRLPGERSSYNGPEATATIGNAYSVIRQFFEMRGLDEWERCLRHVLFFALSTDDPDEGGCKEDTLYLYNSVCELVAACWVVRQNPLL